MATWLTKKKIQGEVLYSRVGHEATASHGKGETNAERRPQPRRRRPYGRFRLDHFGLRHPPLFNAGRVPTVAGHIVG